MSKTPLDFDYAEAEQGFILLFHTHPDGSRDVVRSEYPDTVIKALDAGAYDRHLPVGMQLVVALWTGMQGGDFTLLDCDLITVWRWVVAAVFIGMLERKNGVIEAQTDDGGTELTPVFVGEGGRAMNVFMSSVRLALAVQMEDIAYQRYPGEMARDMILRTYNNMITTENGVLALSEFGDEMLSLLHNSFLRTIYNDGIPPAPTEH